MAETTGPRPARIREVVSSLIILGSIILIGGRLSIGWLTGVVGGTLRLTVMVQDRRWFYVALDVCFVVVDIVMFGAWNGWWLNPLEEFIRMTLTFTGRH